MSVLDSPVADAVPSSSALPSGPNSTCSPAGRNSLNLLLVLGLCSFLFFHGLSAGDFYRTEGLRALIAQEFLRSGDWIVPRLYGQPHLTKPPGMYAAIALGSWPAGTVCEWTARLPSAAAATLAVVLFSGYFRRQLGSLAGLVAAVVLPMSILWLTYTPSAEIDMLQVAWVTAAILCFLRALEIAEACPPTAWVHVSALSCQLKPIAPHHGSKVECLWWLAALLCVAGGFLTKWTAPAFFYGTVVPLLWWRRRLRLLVRWPHLVSVSLAASLCLAWIGAVVALAGWSTFADTVSREALLRLLPGEHRPYPWSKLLTHPLLLLATTLPWSAVALVALWPGFAQLFDPRGQRLLQALHCWVWPNLFFWSVVPERAVRHSFPLFPGLAGLATLVWLAWLTGRLRWPFSPLRPAPVLAGALALWLLVKLTFVHVAIPARNETRQPRAKGEQLAACVPEGKTLYVFGLKNKDEGILFYYGRAVRRLPGPACLSPSEGSVYALLDEPEWREEKWAQAAEVILPLQDEQGAVIVLVRFPAPEEGAEGYGNPLKVSR